MLLHIKLSTTLRDKVPGYNPAQGLDFELRPMAEAPLVRDAALALGLEMDDIKIVMINGRQSSLSDPVAEGDRVAFFPAVGGG